MKVFFILNVIVLLLSLSACGNRADEPTNTSADTNTVPNNGIDTEDQPASDDPANSNTNAGNANNENMAEEENNEPATFPELSAMNDAIKHVASTALYALNTAIRQGEMLDAQQSICLRTFDPAFGESLLSIECDQPLFTNDVSIGVTRASFEQSEACQSGMAVNDSSQCVLSATQFNLPVQWTVSDSNSAVQRPLPLSGGAAIQYKVDSNNLRISNLPSALTGSFECEIALNSAQVITSNGTNCTTLMVQFTKEITDLLGSN